MIFPVLLSYFLLARQVLCIWPAPQHFEHGSSVLWLAPDFEVSVQLKERSLWQNLQIFLRLPKLPRHDEQAFASEFLPEASIERLRARLASRTFSPWKFHPRDTSFEPEARTSDAVCIHEISIEIYSKPVYADSVESYMLDVAESGKTIIRASGRPGINHAFNTLNQLFFRHSKSQEALYTTLAPCHVEDAPRFAHRGLNLDISRNIVSPKDVMRTIEGLSLNKFNRLHLHASDAQSWPLEIPSMPELAEKGAYHPSQIWTSSDLREVQSFGASQGVHVYIEIDMPGHTASVQESHPELLISFNRKPWEKFSAQPPSGQLKLKNSDVEDFISTLLNDLLPRSKPFSSLFHLGGDEITASAYDMSPSEVRPHLQAFMDHAIRIVHSHGLTPVVWEEHVLDYNLTLPDDTMVQAWRGASSSDQPSALAQLVSRGQRALFGANDHWYLDCGHGGWVDRATTSSSSQKGDNSDSSSSGSPIKPPFLDYCSPLKNWRQVLSYDPLADVPPQHAHLVLGGEVSLWGELTDALNLDRNLWPRAAAAAEVLWSGSGGGKEKGKGYEGERSTRRLAEMRERLVAMGVAAEPVQVTWCLMYPGNCVS